MAIVYKILIGLMFFASASDVTDTTSTTSPEANNSRVGLRGYNQYDFASCQDFAGKPMSEGLNSSQTDFEKQFLADLKNTVSNVIAQNRDIVGYLNRCLKGHLGSSCNDEKTAFLEENQKMLKTLRENAHMKRLALVANKTGVLMDGQLDRTYDGLSFTGHRGQVKGLSESELAAFKSRVQNLQNSATQRALSSPNDPSCIVGEGVDRRVKENDARCGTLYRTVIKEEVARTFSRESDAREEETKGILLKFPWLGEHTDSKLDPRLVQQGLAKQYEVMSEKMKEVSQMNESKSKGLIAYPEIVEALLQNQNDASKKQAYCSIAQSTLKRKENLALAKHLGIAGVALMGLALCPFTSGLTCLAIGGVSTSATAANTYGSYKAYQDARSDYTSGIIRRESFLDKERQYQTDLAVTAASAAAGGATLAVGAGKTARAARAASLANPKWKAASQRISDGLSRLKSTSVREQREAIRSLGDLNINTRGMGSGRFWGPKPSQYNPKMLQVTEDLVKFARNPSTSPELKREAVAAAIKYTRTNSGNYRLGYMGRRGPEALQELYFDPSIPSSARRQVFEAMRAAYREVGFDFNYNFLSNGQIQRMIRQGRRVPGPRY